MYIIGVVMANVNFLEKIKEIEKEIKQLKTEVALGKPRELSEEELDKRDAEILRRAIARKQKEGWIDLTTLVKTYSKEGLI
ncbi:MAG: hypothetical protein Q8O75_03550 [bacterium]|nr:hypothetical protein [bacterium]